MRERGEIAEPRSLTVTVDQGHYETLICEACGYTEWFARGLPDEHVPVTIEPRDCPECHERRAFHVVEVLERDGQGRAVPLRVAPTDEGRVSGFKNLICEGCGYTEWHAHHLDEILRRPSRDVHAAGGRTCDRCRGSERVRVETIREAGALPRPLPVVLDAWLWFLSREHGRFSIEICRRCGYTEWFARGLEGLKEDLARGIRLVQGTAPRAAEGPYR
jgi:predicted nucleic-acid-binding Zn-ribbon protein